MTRGRKKDLTIPPTRSLVQQRDYRARKANYIASLEERCNKAEEENAQLRKELADTRARLANPAILLPETAQVSSELMRNLALARDSLAKFHQLAFPEGQADHTTSLPPTPQSSQLSQPPQEYPTPPSSLQTLAPRVGDNTKGRKRLYVDDDESFSPISYATSTPATFRSPTPDSNGECCGGFIDCDDLCDSEEESDSGPLSRISGLRSTSSDYRLPK